MNAAHLFNCKTVRTSPRVPRRERGQIIPLALVSLSTFLCFCGLVIDGGRLYVGYQQLLASTDASALAGGSGLPTSATAIADATSYSSLSGKKNEYGNLSGVTMVSGYPAVKCIAYTTLAIACDGVTSYNAIQVRQQVTVPMTFAKFFGAPSVTLVATATASSRGSNTTPYNVAVILDTTQSMGQSGSDSCTDSATGTKYKTSEDCAQLGVKTLLLNTAPCAGGVTCSGGTTNAVDMVSLLTFPNVTAATAKNDYTSPCNDPSTLDYSYPLLNDTTYAPGTTSTTTPTYLVTGFLSDYRTSDTATTLNTSSQIVNAIGFGSQSGCTGLGTPGGKGTYYAGALAAAQSIVLQQQALRTGSQNAIIILSDGEAQSSDLSTTDLTGKTKVSTTAATYPSTTNECQQAIDAATKISSFVSAAGTKTTIYSVAYGSDTTTGVGKSACSTDKTGANAGISACTTMQDLATSSTTFFTDTPSGSTSTCKSSLQPAQGLAQIFQAIAGDLTKARLIPNSVWGS